FDTGVEDGAQRVDLELEVTPGRPISGRQENLENVLLPEGRVAAAKRRDDAVVPSVEPNAQCAVSPSDADGGRKTRLPPRARGAGRLRREEGQGGRVAELQRRKRDEAIGRGQRRDGVLRNGRHACRIVPESVTRASRLDRG